MTSHVIIGSGFAGLKAAETIRQLDANATIIILTEEGDLPYWRPRLPDFIARTVTADKMLIRQPAWLAESFPTWHGAGGPLYNYRDYDKFVRAYLGTLLSVDDSVGLLYDTLKQTGQLDRTLIIYTSDNGFALGEHGRVDKRTMYEESIRVPLIVRYPPLIPKPKVINEMVLNTMATIETS